MTNQSINIKTLLRRLTSESTHYYIEQKEIVTKITLNGRTLFSRYKRFEGKITPTLIEQHLHKEITLAIPINNNIKVFKYAGKNIVAFASLLFYIAKEFSINNLVITNYSQEKITILYITEYNGNTNGSFLKKAKEILELKLPNEWKILPNSTLPEVGNLLELPREICNLDSF